MPNMNDVLELLRAGYTRAEIDAMQQPNPQQPNPQQPNPQQPNPQPEQPDPQPEQPAQDPVIEQMSKDFAAAIADLRRTIQENNIKDSKNPKPEQMTAEQALGSLNGPPQNRNKE